MTNEQNTIEDLRRQCEYYRGRIVELEWYLDRFKNLALMANLMDADDVADDLISIAEKTL